MPAVMTESDYRLLPGSLDNCVTFLVYIAFGTTSRHVDMSAGENLRSASILNGQKDFI